MHSIFDNTCDPVCLVGDKYFNSISWADDLVLISQSEKGLQKSLDLLSAYSHTWSICINTPKKPVCMVLAKGKSKKKHTFFRNGDILDQVNSVNYVGFYLTDNLNPKSMIDDRIIKANRVALCIKAKPIDKWK